MKGINLKYSENAIIEVTKEFTFESAHYLEEYRGDCSNTHGHSYKLQVTVRGKMNDTGIIMDFKEIKEIVHALVVKKFDHKCLNKVFNFNPTAENMVVYIFELLEKYFIQLKDRGLISLYTNIVSVKLWETSTSFAEYRGEHRV